ncbi:14695_t:CDS:2, partial [Gigaspora margarita]
AISANVSKVGFEIYEHCELVSIELFEKDKNYKAAKSRRLIVNKGDEKEKIEFIQRLKIYIDVYHHLSEFKDTEEIRR